MEKFLKLSNCVVYVSFNAPQPIHDPFVEIARNALNSDECRSEKKYTEFAIEALEKSASVISHRKSSNYFSTYNTNIVVEVSFGKKKAVQEITGGDVSKYAEFLFGVINEMAYYTIDEVIENSAKKAVEKYIKY